MIQTPLNTAYQPVSKADSLQVHVPTSMAFEIHKALEDIERINGNIDEYVRRKLKYPSKEDLFDVLAAEQIDGVAMAIHQIEKGFGLIIGDQTGIGKGRQAAAIIRYGIMNGYSPIFITEKPHLFSDMYRDLVDIDSGGFMPLVYNLGEDGDIKDQDGNVIYKAFRNNQKLQALIEGESQLPLGYDFQMCTYSQLQGDAWAAYNKITPPKKDFKPGPQYKTQFLRMLAKDNIVILDESHNAGGLDSVTGTYIRDILKPSQGALYLSATYAKRPDNMPLYAVKTAMKEANLGDLGLIAAIEAGGLALQEINSSLLGQSGQMIRRQRTFEGIKVSYKTLTEVKEKHTEIFDKITEIIRDIIEFQETYVGEVITGKNKILQEQGDGAEETKGTKKAGIDNVPYFSKIFNVIDQLLFAIKAEEVAKEAIKQLNDNKKVVIAFKSTMGSFLSDFDFVEGEHIGHIDFSTTLYKGLEGVMKYTERNVFEETTVRYISKEELSPLGRMEYDRIKEAIRNASSGLHISPIDVIIDIIERTKRPKDVGGIGGAFYKVGEVTGRKQRIEGITTDDPVIRSFKSNTEQSFREFNSGDIDVLMINSSGATGASAHSSSEFKDQRQRVMLIHQPELNISTEIQKRGRINRTGQVNKPEYIYISSAIPAEERLFMMLKAKLKSLDANTTGSQKTSDAQLESPDFLNKYGDKVVEAYLREHEDLNKKLGNPLHFGNKKKEAGGGADAAKKASGRVAVLPVAEQAEFYENILAGYNNYIRKLKEADEYDLEMDFLDLQAETESSYVIIEGKGGFSPFGNDSIIEKVTANVLRKPYTQKELDEQLLKVLDGQTPVQYNAKLRKHFESFYPGWMEQKLVSKRKQLKKTQLQLAELPQDPPEEERYKVFEKREKLERKITEQEKDLNRWSKEYEERKNTISSFFNTFYIGKVTKVRLNDFTESWAYGVCLGIHIDTKKKNPYRLSNITIRFAVADGRRSIRVAGSDSIIYSLIHHGQKIDHTTEQEILAEWNELYPVKDRETRFIVTGNILQAIGSYKGKLVKYTQKNGDMANGILLPESFGKQAGELQTARLISEAVEQIYNLSMGEELSSNRGEVRFKNQGDHFKVYISKSRSKMVTDITLLQHLMLSEQEKEEGVTHGKFTKAGGNEMQGLLERKQLKKFCQVLADQYNIMVNTKAAEIKGQSKTSAQKPKVVPKLWKYELQKPFGSGAYPTVGYEKYEESSNSPYGYVFFNRPLAPKEKSNYSLIPVFHNAQEAIKEWEQQAVNTPWKKSELEKLIAQQKDEPYETAIHTLGYFITNNAHEPGNKEFIFGTFSEKELGAALYEALIGMNPYAHLKEIDKVIMELEILLAA